MDVIWSFIMIYFLYFAPPNLNSWLRPCQKASTASQIQSRKKQCETKFLTKMVQDIKQWKTDLNCLHGLGIYIYISPLKHISQSQHQWLNSLTKPIQKSSIASQIQSRKKQCETKFLTKMVQDIKQWKTNLNCFHGLGKYIR